MRIDEIEANKTAVFTFARMNPPTKGHARLITKVQETAQELGARDFIFLSRSNDTDKNPLSFEQKSHFLNAFFPKINIMNESYTDADGEVKYINNPVNALEYLLHEGYTSFVLVAGGDRVESFKRPFEFIKDKLPELNLKEYKIVSAGDRDTDDEISKVSATQARDAVKAGNYNLFVTLIPESDDMIQKSLYEQIQQGMETNNYGEQQKINQ